MNSSSVTLAERTIILEVGRDKIRGSRTQVDHKVRQRRGCLMKAITQGEIGDIFPENVDISAQVAQRTSDQVILTIRGDADKINSINEQDLARDIEAHRTFKYMPLIAYAPKPKGNTVLTNEQAAEHLRRQSVLGLAADTTLIRSIYPETNGKVVPPHVNLPQNQQRKVENEKVVPRGEYQKLEILVDQQKKELETARKKNMGLETELGKTRTQLSDMTKTPVSRGDLYVQEMLRMGVVDRTAEAGRRYDEVIKEGGIDLKGDALEQLSNLATKAQEPFEETDFYKANDAKIKRAQTALAAPDDEFVNKPEARKFLDNVEVQRKKHDEETKKVSQLSAALKGVGVKYLITTQAAEGKYRVGVVMPITFKEKTEEFSELETDLISHVHDQWSKFRGQLNVEFQRTNRNGLVEYQFEIPTENVPAKVIDNLVDRLSDELFNSQTGYSFSKLGLRVDVEVLKDTSHRALENKDSSPESISPGRPDGEKTVLYGRLREIRPRQDEIDAERTIQILTPGSDERPYSPLMLKVNEYNPKLAEAIDEGSLNVKTGYARQIKEAIISELLDKDMAYQQLRTKIGELTSLDLQVNKIRDCFNHTFDALKRKGFITITDLPDRNKRIVSLGEEYKK